MMPVRPAGNDEAEQGPIRNKLTIHAVRVPPEICNAIHQVATVDELFSKGRQDPDEAIMARRI